MSERPSTGSPPGQRRLERLRRRIRGAAPFASGVLATLAALLLYSMLVPAPRPLTAGEVGATVAEVLASVTPVPAYSARAYQIIQPSLVIIQTQGPGAGGQPEYGVGSGVVVDDSGSILTSLHVVANAAEIQLTFADGTQSLGQVVAAQPENDIAVLIADQLPAQLVPATLGNPNAMRIGDEAFVVGHPLGLAGSISAGVISGFERTFQPPGSDQALEGLIQIDAAVNPGNSGGPLLNRQGQVVGIITGLVNPTGQDVFIGIGFAVPIDVAGGAAGLPPY
jgi:S1-C subfamily serine protease